MIHDNADRPDAPDWWCPEVEQAIRAARREQMERDCREMCRFCENGHSLQFSCGHAQMPNTAHWRHPEPNVVCKANAIRRAFEEQK